MPLGTLQTQSGDGIVFEVSADKIRTWHEAKRTRSARWARHEVHLAEPVKEFLGPGDESLSLSVRLDAARGVDVAADIEILATLCKTGQVVQFTMGDTTPEGENAQTLIGDYVIDSVSEEWRRVDARGRLITAIVEIAMEVYS